MVITMKIDVQQLREKDIVLRIDHSVGYFDLDDEYYKFEGRVKGEVNFHLVGKDVFARGEVRARAVGRCFRCLEPVPLEICATINYVYMPKSTEPTGDVVVENVDPDAANPAYYSGDLIFPRDEIRESLLLAVPELPLRSEDGSRCLVCGRDLTVSPHREDWPEKDGVATDWKQVLKKIRPSR